MLLLTSRAHAFHSPLLLYQLNVYINETAHLLHLWKADGYQRGNGVKVGADASGLMPASAE